MIEVTLPLEKNSVGLLFDSVMLVAFSLPAECIWRWCGEKKADRP